MVRIFSRVILGLIFLTLFAGCQQQKNAEPVQLSGLTMGTTWSVSLLPDVEGLNPNALKRLLQQRLDQINGLMSTYDPASEISRFNTKLSDDWFPISAETAEVIRLSRQISQLTNGAFDITVGPLVELWGFGATKRTEHIPGPKQVSALLDRVGYEKLELRENPPAIRKTVPTLRVDLSAIAKGYAVDLLAEQLKNQGVNNFLLEVGGEMRLSGQRSDGTPWKIGIEKPQEDLREVKTVFPLTATAVATSGNYRNYYDDNGERYSHTIDPVTGRPIRHKLASVTVLDPSCAKADALATAMMVLGEARGRELSEKNQLAVYFLIHENESIIEYASPAFTAFRDKMKK